MTHAEAAKMSNMAKYSGLKSTAMASFQPKTTRTPYIHKGI